MFLTPYALLKNLVDTFYQKLYVFALNNIIQRKSQDHHQGAYNLNQDDSNLKSESKDKKFSFIILACMMV